MIGYKYFFKFTVQWLEWEGIWMGSRFFVAGYCLALEKNQEMNRFLVGFFLKKG